MAAVVATELTRVASEASEKFSTAASKVRSENKETFDQIEGQCSGVSSTFSIVGNEVVEAARSAFFPYVLVTFLLNLPPFAYGLASVFSPDCNSSWLLFNAFLDAVHMGIAVYAVSRIRAANVNKGLAIVKDEEEETPYVLGPPAAPLKPQETAASSQLSKTAGGEPNSWDRIRVVMCYDMVMAIYYMLGVVWVIWQGIGTRRVIDNEVDAPCGRWVVISVLCGFLYMGLGVVAWVGSLCFVRYNTLRSQPKDSSSGSSAGMLDIGGIA